MFDVSAIGRIPGARGASCHTRRRNPTRHETYRCSGYIAMSKLLLEYANDLRLAAQDGVVGGDLMASLLHALSYHFMPLSSQVWEQLGEALPISWLDWFTYQLALILLADFIVCVIGLVISAGLRTIFSWTYRGAKTSIRRLSPDAIVAHAPLLNYLLDSEGKTQTTSITRQVVDNSANGIIAIDRNMLIESVNQATQKILGFNPEQLLGQDLRLIFIREDGEKIERQTQLMIKHEASQTFSAGMTCVTDAEAQVPVAVNVLGLSANRQRDVSNFVISIKDVSVLHQQQAEAAEAKRRSEQLLYEILPREVVSRLNAGERDICFVVQCTTLAFLDIARFSDFAEHLNPQETMRTLSTIFQGYDGAITKYGLCMKMKFVGDVYMMAAGLFAPGIEPEKHAEESVRFCLDCLDVIEETNRTLNSDLAVRVGVNTGGPITAGVLGADKPLFDIIGDPINVAARLQTTAPPGKVQISESTHGFIKAVVDLAIEPRGEVMLKGKGKRPAFLVSVRPPVALPFAPPQMAPAGSFIRAMGSRGLIKAPSAIGIRPPGAVPPDLIAMLSGSPSKEEVKQPGGGAPSHDLSVLLASGP